jgi:hypothetical protein
MGGSIDKRWFTGERSLPAVARGELRGSKAHHGARRDLEYERVRRGLHDDLPLWYRGAHKLACEQREPDHRDENRGQPRIRKDISVLRPPNTCHVWSSIVAFVVLRALTRRGPG